MTTPEIDPDEVLAHYKWAFLQCRVDRHLWSRDPRFDMPDPHTIERSQICEACMTIRFVWIDRDTMERLTAYRYRYPKDFLTPKSGLTFTDFRERLDRESIEKALKAGKVPGAPDPKLVKKRQAKEAG